MNEQAEVEIQVPRYLESMIKNVVGLVVDAIDDGTPEVRVIFKIDQENGTVDLLIGRPQ